MIRSWFKGPNSGWMDGLVGNATGPPIIWCSAGAIRNLRNQMTIYPVAVNLVEQRRLKVSHRILFTMHPLARRKSH